VYRNWNSYEKKIKGIGAQSFFTLCDPQTNGGLMVAVDPAQRADFETLLTAKGLAGFATPIGRMIAKAEAPLLIVNPA